MRYGKGVARRIWLAALCVWPLAGLAHTAHGTAQQRPVWVTQGLVVLAWGLYIGGGVRRPPAFGPRLLFARIPLYSGADSALADQQMAGLVMWVPGGLVYWLAAVWAASRWLGSPAPSTAVLRPRDPAPPRP